MATKLIIREVRRDDLDQWRVLWDGYNAFYGREGPTSLPEQVTKVSWERFFDSHEPVYGAVAERGGQLVGLAHFLFHRSTTAIEPSCYMQDLFTSEAARGEGVGSGLIDYVYQQARLRGARRVYWQTQRSNRIAMRLYNQVAEESGFIVYRKLL